MEPSKYRCPACGFQIFNRRVAKCESCRAELPPELLLTPDATAKLDAEYERSMKGRDARIQKEREERERSRIDEQTVSPFEPWRRKW